MGAALSIFVLLSLSIFVVRIASVALRLTGLEETRARFQALSAFTGTGFTTSEAETVVNYPIRRRIIVLLMIIGNMGLVTVFATVVVSLVNTAGKVDAVMVQLAWLLSGLALLWFLMLNKTADRILCLFISKVLESTTVLGKRKFTRLLQIADGFSVCEHMINYKSAGLDHFLTCLNGGQADLTVIAIRTSNNNLITDFSSLDNLRTGDSLIIFGGDADHELLWGSE